MIMKPPRCWRNLTECEPLHSVEGLPPNMTDADYDALEGGTMQPASFICGGCVKEEARAIPQDAYRMCWVNDEVDEMGEYDEQDITHQMLVMSQVLAIIASRRVNGGTIDVMTNQAEP